MAQVTDAKKKEVQEFVKLASEYPVVGIVNVQGLPTPQLQAMREKLRGTALVKMTKKTISRIILNEAAKNKTGIEKLSENLKGMPAFIFTKDNPFTLFKTLKKNKSTAPAKAGQEAPNDIVVPAGPTPFAPGPIIGELGMVGIKSSIDAGKVVVKEDSLVAKEGTIISSNLAAILTRLGIEPMEVGLELVAVYENGSLFKKNILDIDEDKYISDITTGHRWAFNLAVEAGVLTSETTELMFINAQRDAVAFAISQAIVSKDVIDQIISKAAREANSVKSQIDA